MTSDPKKILYFFDQTDWQSRMPVVDAARNRGYDVSIVIIGSEKPKQIESFITQHGFIKTTSGSMNLWSFLSVVIAMFKVIQTEKPDIVHSITLKYAFMTGLAVFAFPKVFKIYTLAGLGYLFRNDSKSARFLSIVFSPLLYLTFAEKRTFLIFQNPDDQSLMIHKRLANQKRSILIRGSGVDLEKFRSKTMTDNVCPVVLMPTRLVREKGIDIFVQAAEILKNKNTEAHFKIVGGLTKHNPSALSRAEMESFTKSGSVLWLGHQENMPDILAQADIIVYPSYYGEGIPRVLLEAAACGKPIITTDNPGCREAVIENENGLLVPIKKSQALAQAILDLLNDPKRRYAMGHKSREIAERDFNIYHIAERTVSVYDGAIG